MLLVGFIIRLVLCYVNLVFSMNVLLPCVYEPCLLETQEHVVVLIHETAPKITYVEVVNALDHVLGDNTLKRRVLLLAFIAVFGAPLAFI